MNEALRKLRFVHVNAPLLLQPRIARVIEAVSNSTPNGVEAPITQKIKPRDTPLLLLQDNADSFLALMRTLPKKHPFKEMVSEMNSLADKLASKLEESGQELSKILQTDEEDLPGIKSSALGGLADLIQSEKTRLAELQELTKTLTTLAGKAHKEEKTKPVEHEMPSKDLGSKKKKESPGIGEEAGAGAPEGPEAKAPKSTQSSTPDLALM